MAEFETLLLFFFRSLSPMLQYEFVKQAEIFFNEHTDRAQPNIIVTHCNKK